MHNLMTCVYKKVILVVFETRRYVDFGLKEPRRPTNVSAKKWYTLIIALLDRSMRPKAVSRPFSRCKKNTPICRAVSRQDFTTNNR